jgi:hypothetical protein
MTSITDSIRDAAKRKCDLELSAHQAHVVFIAMGHHKSIRWKDYVTLDRMRSENADAFDELVRKTTGVMQHYDFSLKVFDMALRYHDPNRRAPA